MIPEDFGLARFRFSLAGDTETMNCTIGVQYHTSSAGLWSDLLYDAFMSTGWAVAANMGTIWTFGGVALSYNDGNGIVEYESSAPAHVGAAGVLSPPSNCACLVRKRTALGGRKHRGRMYVPFINTGEGSIDHNGVITSEQRALIQTHWSGFLAKVEVDDGNLYVFHNDAGVTPPTEITGLEVQSRIATQRRRMR